MTRFPEATLHVHDLSHTADAGFTVSAPTLPALFERAGLGLMRIVADPSGGVERATRAVTVQADDLGDLLHHFLAEVLLAVLVDGCLVCAIDVVHLDATSVHASLLVDDVAALQARHYQEVKAITYHELAVEQRDGGWWARVIVDI